MLNVAINHTTRVILTHMFNKEDLEGFVKQKGFLTIKDYFMDLGMPEEEYNTIITVCTRQPYDMLADEIKTYSKDEDEELFKYFMNKYHSQINNKLDEQPINEIYIR